ncbi:NAD(P)-dependent oxidoreductase [Hydrogenophaga sp.]|uniref:NAD(P)-dependent oxidoreductase n=1 Tax=Hydrogenophaga sp. TaxID=1904254 RepID=UPI00271CEFAD|nr:NAD(P)-dependent oxidoreductase [Hydrogenophaga sp.]MDO8905632.1 NAD(P)-dependent oxidoreductase [Hydrogenophaga sp.]
MFQLAFIGLGAMGLPMARNLLRNRFAVRGFDINPQAMQLLVAEGGVATQSTREAACDAELLILMVVNAAQAEDILFEGEALDAMAPGGIVCLMATCPPGSVERIAARVTSSGRRFVDAPVSGGTAGAIAGTLTVMAACEASTFTAVRPVFEVLGKRIFHVGTQPGQGAMVKTVNQLLCGVHIAVAAEAFSLAAKVGVDLKVLLDIMGGSSASSWMLKDRGPRMIQPDPQVTSAVDIFVKDLGIVLETGRETQTALPIAAVAHQMFLATAGRGDGRADDSQVIRSYSALSGVASLSSGCGSVCNI